MSVSVTVPLETFGLAKGVEAQEALCFLSLNISLTLSVSSDAMFSIITTLLKGLPDSTQHALCQHCQAFLREPWNFVARLWHYVDETFYVKTIEEISIKRGEC